MSCIVHAMQVLNSDANRREVFGESVNTVKADRQTKLGYLTDAALEFTADILDEFEFPSPVSLGVVAVEGLESTTDFLKGTGTIRLQAAVKSLSGVNVHMDLYMPYVRGDLYRPSTIMIAGKHMLLSVPIVTGLIQNLETTRPVLYDMYSPNSNFSHIENAEHEMFCVPDQNQGIPYYELYIQDSYRR